MLVGAKLVFTTESESLGNNIMLTYYDDKGEKLKSGQRLIFIIEDPENYPLLLFELLEL